MDRPCYFLRLIKKRAGIGLFRLLLSFLVARPSWPCFHPFDFAQGVLSEIKRHGLEARATFLSIDSCAAAFHKFFDFLEACHSCVAGGCHRKCPVGRAVVYDVLRVLTFEESVNQA